MNEQQIEAMVKRVLAGMQPRTLIVLGDEADYRSLIIARLQQCQQRRFAIYIPPSAAAVHSAEQWQGVGEILAWDGNNAAQFLAGFDAVWLPFLDIATLAEIANGLFGSPSSVLVQTALMKGLSTIALDYQCRLDSELNQLKGLSSNPAMIDRLAVQRQTVQVMGLNIGSIGLFDGVPTPEENQSITTNSVHQIEPTLPRFITLSEVMEKGAAVLSDQGRLTDLAQEYVKAQHGK